MINRTRVFAMLLCVVCLFSTAVMAQKKSRKNKAAGCRATSVPKGMVIVGYESGPCHKAIVQPAANGVAMCVGQPVPDGFTPYVQGMAAVSTCPDNRTFVIYAISPGVMAQRGFRTNKASNEKREWDQQDARCNAEASLRTERMIVVGGITDPKYIEESAGFYKSMCKGWEDLKKP